MWWCRCGVYLQASLNILLWCQLFAVTFKSDIWVDPRNFTHRSVKDLIILPFFGWVLPKRTMTFWQIGSLPLSSRSVCLGRRGAYNPRVLKDFFKRNPEKRQEEKWSISFLNPLAEERIEITDIA